MDFFSIMNMVLCFLLPQVGVLTKVTVVLLYLHSLRNEYLLAPLLSGKTDPLQKLEY